MAEEHHNHQFITPVEEAAVDVPAAASSVETQDRGIFDFLSKKDDEKLTPPPQTYPGEEEVLVAEFDKVQVSEPKVEVVVVEEEKVDEEKKQSFFEKLHNDSSSSSSSDEEEEGSEKKEKKKKKKGLKEKIKEKITGGGEEDTTVPIEKYEEEEAVAAVVVPPEEKKGFLEKIKDKLPGQKKTEEVPAPAPVAAVEVVQVEETKEKKGILEKIKEKLPGYHPKTTEEEKGQGSD
ncbi:phosphoprotein ECPP44 [Impatiens glandulifera]|uniref:phosphoprotein ECPP44 n=1 Tax=Impatiens glandulifera TaxID=253017 RepID=UPI001FB09BA8|nr:phosphoprotein ECPP44 [Impatiens glandulifera]